MISIIIVGYNSKKYLNDCLKSIFNSDYKNFRIIFVDNNSSDGSINFIKKKFPKVLIVPNKKNLGFAGGNNLGIKEAIKLGSDFIFLLNPDTIIDSKCLNILIRKSNKNIILQPLILLHENNKKTDLINTTGNYLNFLGFSYCNDYKKIAENMKQEQITSASGAAMLIPIKIIQKIGMFDEDFFMYHEDVDLCWRARIAGFNIKLIPNAKVWHKYNFSNNKKKYFYVERNRILFLYKNFNVKYLLLILPLFIVNEFFILFYSLIDGWFGLKIKSYLSLAKLIKIASQKKKKNLTNINKAAKKLKKFIGSKISFSEVKSPFLYPYNVILNLYWKLIYPLI